MAPKSESGVKRFTNFGVKKIKPHLGFLLYKPRSSIASKFRHTELSSSSASAAHSHVGVRQLPCNLLQIEQAGPLANLTVFKLRLVMLWSRGTSSLVHPVMDVGEDELVALQHDHLLHSLQQHKSFHSLQPLAHSRMESKFLFSASQNSNGLFTLLSSSSSSSSSSGWPLLPPSRPLSKLLLLALVAS